jgi:hypothetical protein
MVAALEAAPLLESLSLDTEGMRSGDKAALERFLRHDAARPLPRLRELPTKGFAFDLNCLRGLQLRKLSLNEVHVAEWTDDPWISALPEWIAEMPLTELAILHAHQLRRLPSSLAGLKSLRFLDLHGSGIASLFDRQSIHDGEFDAPTPSEAGAMTNANTRLLLANGTLVIRLFTRRPSELAYDYVIYEVSRMRLRGWHNGIPGLITASSCVSSGGAVRTTARGLEFAFLSRLADEVRNLALGISEPRGRYAYEGDGPTRTLFTVPATVGRQ